MAADNRRQGNEAEAFLRQWTLPEEDKAKYTAARRNGEYRGFDRQMSFA
jgi:hypothetical protein